MKFFTAVTAKRRIDLRRKDHMEGLRMERMTTALAKLNADQKIHSIDSTSFQSKKC